MLALGQARWPRRTRKYAGHGNQKGRVLHVAILLAAAPDNGDGKNIDGGSLRAQNPPYHVLVHQETHPEQGESSPSLQTLRVKLPVLVFLPPQSFLREPVSPLLALSDG